VEKTKQKKCKSNNNKKNNKRAKRAKPIENKTTIIKKSKKYKICKRIHVW
jgi:hypothetical protein